MTLPARTDAGLGQRQAGMARALTAAGCAWPPELLAAVVPGGTLDAEAALGVYRSGYVARLTEQLGETFEAVWRVLGDEDFFALAARYIAGHSSSSYNLSDYGRDFPAFLETAGETATAPFLPELARFELAFHDLFHAPAHRPVAAAELARLASTGDLGVARLRIGTAVQLLACRRAVYELFRRRHESAAPDLAIDRPQWMLLYKQGDDVMACEVEAAAFTALDALRHGSTVEEAIEAAVARDATFGADEVARLFETIGRCGLVSGWER